MTTANFQLTKTLGFTAEAVDNAGAPIQGVGWTVFTHNATTGQWDTPQYGPRMTDDKGQVFWRTVAGRLRREPSVVHRPGVCRPPRLPLVRSPPHVASSRHRDRTRHVPPRGDVAAHQLLRAVEHFTSWR